MQLSAYLDREKMEQYVRDGLVRRQVHPSGDLSIVNYTVRAELSRTWDDVTRKCRGLIYHNKTGEIVSRSYDKFFNLGQMPETQLEALPNETPVITTKQDGFLGISYWWDGKIAVASRGSFTSEFAVWATDWLRNSISDAAVDACLDSRYSFVFEILYPYKRIVVDNSEKYGLVLLTAFDMETPLLSEVPYNHVLRMGLTYGWPVTESHNEATIKSCIASTKVVKGSEYEGWVAHYPNSGLRVKLKGEDYCRIQKLVTRLTKWRVWEMVQIGARPAGPALMDVIASLPVEYANWVRQIGAILCIEHAKLFRRAKAVAEFVRTEGPFSRKQLVAMLEANYADIWHEVLYILDGKEAKAEGSFWKRLEPFEFETPIVKENHEDE